MKILAPGKKPKEWKLVVFCTGRGNSSVNACGAKLEIELNDLVFYPGVSGDSWGSRDPAYSFKCPQCETRTDIVKEYYPPRKNYDENMKLVDSSWYHN